MAHAALNVGATCSSSQCRSCLAGGAAAGPVEGSRSPATSPPSPPRIWAGARLPRADRGGSQLGARATGKFTAVLAASELPEGKLKRALFKESPILLVKRGTKISLSRRLARTWAGRWPRESSKTARSCARGMHRGSTWNPERSSTDLRRSLSPASRSGFARTRSRYGRSGSRGLRRAEESDARERCSAAAVTPRRSDRALSA